MTDVAEHTATHAWHDEAWAQERAARAQAGDAAAFGDLARHYGRRIYTHLFRLVGHREEAEDLTQEAFIRAFRFLGRYDAKRSFRNWLYTVATNVGLNALRSQRRRGQPVSLDTAPGPIALDERDTAARREQAARVKDAVQQLPPRMMQLVDLHYREGFSIREAAEVVGMSEGAAKVALHRARKQLREWLVEEQGQ